MKFIISSKDEEIGVLNAEKKRWVSDIEESRVEFYNGLNEVNEKNEKKIKYYK